MWRKSTADTTCLEHQQNSLISYDIDNILDHLKMRQDSGSSMTGFLSMNSNRSMSPCFSITICQEYSGITIPLSLFFEGGGGI